MFINFTLVTLLKVVLIFSASLVILYAFDDKNFSSIGSVGVLLKIIKIWDNFEIKYRSVFSHAPLGIFKNLWSFKRVGSCIGWLSFAILMLTTKNINNIVTCGLEDAIIQKNPTLFSILCKTFGNFTLFVAINSFADDFKNMVLLKAIDTGFEKVNVFGCLHTLYCWNLILKCKM